MKNRILSLLALAMLSASLVGCSEEKIDEEAYIKSSKAAVRELLASEVKSYTYYEAYALTDVDLGDYYVDYNCTCDITNYSDEVSGSYTLNVCTGSVNQVVTRTTTGMRAMYRDSDGFIYQGNQSEDPYEYYDYVKIFEDSPFVNFFTSFGLFEMFNENGGQTAFLNLNKIYTTKVGYSDKVQTITKLGKGNYRIDISVSAEAEGIYSAEDIRYYAVFNKNFEVSLIGYENKLWSGDRSTTPDASVNGIYTYHNVEITNVVKGSHDGNGTFRFDMENATNVTDNRSHLVDIGETGSLSDSTVLDILANMSAYTAGTKYTDYSATYSNYRTFDEDWEEIYMGPATETCTITRYNNWILEAKDAMTYKPSGSTTNVTEHTTIQYYATEEGNLACRYLYDDGSIYGQDISGSDVMSGTDYYFNANGAYQEQTFRYYLEAELENNDNGIGESVYVNESTYEDGLLTLDLSYQFEPNARYEAYAFHQTRHLVMKFDEDFFCYYVQETEYYRTGGQTKNDCNSVLEYHSYKGDLEDYTGTLIELPDSGE